MTAVATRRNTTIARPLKVLVPLIKEELVAGDEAGLEHYRAAGEMLVEAKDQLAHGAWARWLLKNFDLSDRTARRYMRLAQITNAENTNGTSKSATGGQYRSVKEIIGEPRTREAWRDVFKTADRVNVDALKQEQQTRDEEVPIRRKLALELIDLGYKALATRLHPDRGGSRDAMARLNDIRAELKDIAATRRFV